MTDTEDWKGEHIIRNVPRVTDGQGINVRNYRRRLRGACQGCGKDMGEGATGSMCPACAKVVSPPPRQAEDWADRSICAVPDCQRSLWHGNRSGVCRAHNHLAPFCRCEKCREKRA